MRIERFEDAEVWRLARECAKKIYLRSMTGNLGKDYSFRDQIRRSSVSIMANIAEGLERNTNKELRQFLFIAKGSAGELRSHFYLALDIGYLEEEEFREFTELLTKISKSLSGFIKYLNMPQK